MLVGKVAGSLLQHILLGRHGSRSLLVCRFVHLEERALDEAELPEAAFKGKYETLEAVKREMQEREAELQALSPEERNKAVAAIFHKIALGGSKPCCNHQGSCSHGGSSLPPPPMEPGQGGATMSEEEQLHFFQSLSKS